MNKEEKGENRNFLFGPPLARKPSPPTPSCQPQVIPQVIPQVALAPLEW
jgi:hypothetical protein